MTLDIWGLIPSVAGMICSTGIGTVLGNVAKEYTKDSKRYEQVAAGVSAYLLSGYLADKCSGYADDKVKSVRMTYDQIRKMRAKQRLAMAAEIAREDLELDEEEPNEEDD
jgi:hypothetical protein